jgi:HAD superfamily hydrolase (TIGR01509 family)
MITTIMFDLDGVLVDAQEWHYQALNKALMDVCQCEISRVEHETKYDGLPTKVKLATLEQQGRVTQDKFQAIFNLKQHYTLIMIRDYCRPDPIKIEMMKNLHGYKKACVTNSIAKTAYEMLVLSGLNYYMDYVQGNETTKHAKPNPSPYLNAMSVMGVSPEEVLIVEDSPNGIEAGMKTRAKVLPVTYKTLDTALIRGAL